MTYNAWPWLPHSFIDIAEHRRIQKSSRDGLQSWDYLSPRPQPPSKITEMSNEFPLFSLHFFVIKNRIGYGKSTPNQKNDLWIVAICSEQRDAGVDDDGDELDHLQRGEVPLPPQVLLPKRQNIYFFSVLKAGLHFDINLFRRIFFFKVNILN